MPDFPHGPSRRAVLGGLGGLGGLVALVATGCSVRRTGDGAPASSAASPSSSPTTTRAAVTPDVAVATTALLAVERMRGSVEATGHAFPGSRAELAGLVALHRTHERALADAVPAGQRADSTLAPQAPRGDRDRAVRQLLAAEDRLHQTLAALALQAESGEFARLLASMATAVTLRLDGLA